MTCVANSLDKVEIEFSMRLASSEDSHDVWIWRNEEVTRQMSRNQNLISWQDHNDWFRRSLESSTRVIFIGTVNSQAVSAVRYDHHELLESGLEISISVAREWRGVGVGQRSIFVSLNSIKDFFPLSNLVVANIRMQNLASIKAFLKCGFREMSQVERDFLRFELPI
jgi:RimJ/RimL family protein N-acetyltransferase